MNQIPHARQLPIAQASPARHPRTAAQFIWQHLPRGAAAKDKENTGQARSIRDARPSTFGRRAGIGRKGSRTSHNASGSSVAAIPIDATAPTRIRFRRFCYTLLGRSELTPLHRTSECGSNAASDAHQCRTRHHTLCTRQSRIVRILDFAVKPSLATAPCCVAIHNQQCRAEGSIEVFVHQCRDLAWAAKPSRIAVRLTSQLAHQRMTRITVFRNSKSVSSPFESEKPSTALRTSR